MQHKTVGDVKLFIEGLGLAGHVRSLRIDIQPDDVPVVHVEREATKEDVAALASLELRVGDVIGETRVLERKAIEP